MWTTQVAEALGMKSANLGQEGSSADTAFRLCLGWIDQIKPKIVVYLNPPGPRWELVSKDGALKLSSRWTNFGWPLTPYVQQYLYDDNNDYFNNQKNIMAIETLCRRRSIGFYTYDSIQDLISLQTYKDVARDCLHSGPEANRQFAQHVIKEIQNGSR
jgi:hypothetical protein